MLIPIHCDNVVYVYLHIFVETLVNQNTKILAQNQKLTETIQDMVPQIGNNTINNNQKIF